MDTFQRVSVGLLLLLVATGARADYAWSNGYGDNGSPPYLTPDAGCQATGGYVFDHSSALSETSYQCVGHSVYNTDQINYGPVRRYGDAPLPPKCAIGTPYPKVSWAVGYRTGSTTTSPYAGAAPDAAAISNQNFCTGTCTIVPDTGPSAPAISIQLQSSATAGGYYPIVATQDFIGNGGTCVVSPGTPAPSAPGAAPVPVVAPPTAASAGKDRCPPGTTSGGIDSSGIPICLGTGTAPSSSTTTTAAPKTTTNADGSTTTVTTTQTTNADGSVTTATNSVTSGVKNADGSAGPDSATKSSSTGAAANGTAGKSDVPAKDLCAAHPELNICQNSSVSGSCDQTACTGDAIQCAQLRTAQIAYCETQKDNDLSNMAKALAGNNMAGLPTASNGVVTDVAGAGGQLDAGGFAGGGTCFADKTFSIMGRTVVMSMTPVCNSLGYLKYVVLLCATIAAYKIIASSLLRET